MSPRSQSQHVMSLMRGATRQVRTGKCFFKSSQLDTHVSPSVIAVGVKKGYLDPVCTHTFMFTSLQGTLSCDHFKGA